MGYMLKSVWDLLCFCATQLHTCTCTCKCIIHWMMLTLCSTKMTSEHLLSANLTTREYVFGLPKKFSHAKISMYALLQSTPSLPHPKAQTTLTHPCPTSRGGGTILKVCGPGLKKLKGGGGGHSDTFFFFWGRQIFSTFIFKGEASPSIYADWVNGGWF